MLILKNIKKRYLTSDTYVDALKGISLIFRKSEFVSILGPSGCGKTTLLNIIGGLDKYTSGDLTINGVSTKKFKDSDWDNYRNHSIGFVFQSYNLIPHQTILGNVELALTISGISKKERKQRALKALERVGLKGQEKKRPNQLSGGQMQRVAIARALVNDPEILLADEPTGALDSETSIQVMDLLKEVSKDRLVIMVTHNPDLAKKYSSRIIKIFDGKITGDSKPCKSDLNERKKKTKEKKKSAMSFFTATALSFANLFSKIKRTILITIAGSIGIVGVASVVAVSNGVKDYIRTMQEDMLSSYPLNIAEETVDYTSLTTGLSGWNDKELLEFDPSTKVGLDSMITYLMSAYKGFTNVKTNDISTNFMKYYENMDQSYIAAQTYNYAIDVTNNIFTSWNKDYSNSNEIISLNGLTQRYIAELKTVDGFSDYASYVDLFTDFMKQLPDGSDYILKQYDLLGNSKLATKENEIVLVVDQNTTLTDLNLAQLGFYDHDEFLNIAKKAIEMNKLGNEATQEQKDEVIKKYTYRTSFDYDELIGKKLYYYSHDSIYQYGSYTENPTRTIMAEYKTHNDETYKLTYITLGGYEVMSCEYTHDSTTDTFYMQRQGSAPTDIVNDYDVGKGMWVGINNEEYYLINIGDEPSIRKATSAFGLFSATPTQLTGNLYSKSDNEGFYYKAELDDKFINDNKENCTELTIVGILRLKDNLSFGSLSQGVYYTKALSDKYMKDAFNSNILRDTEHGLLNYIGSEKEKEDPYNLYVTFNYLDYSSNPNQTKESYGYASAINSDLSSSFASLFSGLTGVNNLESDKTALRSLSGLKTIENEGNYSFEKLPQEIEIYPSTFEDKDYITSYLDKWNSNSDLVIDNTTISKDDRSDITYRDTIGMIIAVINTLINAITIALIAFTSLSLVVSCFMIAVITYISVMERVKEIGVIRSLGGRKKDISRLFISETLMTGLFSGLFGIGLTLVLSLIANNIVQNFGVIRIAILTPKLAITMILLSICLSVLSGLIPSIKSASQDPVIALRSE